MNPFTRRRKRTADPDLDLLIWYDATREPTGANSSYTDYSGNGFDATNQAGSPSVTASRINGRNALVMTDSDRKAVADDPQFTVSEFTFFCVFKPVTLVDSVTLLSQWWNFDPGGGRQLSWLVESVYNAGSPYYFLAVSETGDWDDVLYQSLALGSPSAGNVGVIGVSYDSATGNWYAHNGSASASGTASPAQPIWDGTGRIVFNDLDYYTRSGNATDFGEHRLYKGAMGADAIALEVSQLKMKWGIA